MTHSSPVPSLRVEAIDCPSSLSELTPDWAAAADRDPYIRLFQTPLWVVNYWKFRTQSSGPLKLLLGKDAAGAVQAVAPMIREQEGQSVLPPNWVVAHGTGEYEAEWTCPPALAAEFARGVCEHFADDPERWYSLEFRGVRRGSSMAHALETECSRQKLSIQIRDGMEIPYRNTATTSESVDDTLDGKFRRDLRRRTRRLQEVGALSFETHSALEGLEDALNRFFAVEASGWKGEAGTAIASDPTVQRFWRSLAREAAAEGTLRLTLVNVDGQPIAGQLGIICGRTYYCLKTGYDEEFSRYSPGALTTRHCIQECIEDPAVDVYDFAGAKQPYMIPWVHRSTTTCTIRIGSPHPGLRLIFDGTRATREWARPLWRAARDLR